MTMNATAKNAAPELAVLPYRVIVYGKGDEILYDRVHDELELWKLAPGLSIRVRGLDVDAKAPASPPSRKNPGLTPTRPSKRMTIRK